MRINIKFEIENHIIILMIMLCFVLWVTGGFSTLGEYLEEPESILAIHGTLLAGLTALFVGYYSIRAIHNQIEDSQRSRLEQRKDSARIYLAAVVSFLTQLDREIEITARYNAQNFEQVGIVLHETSYAVLAGNEILPLINDWKFYAQLPVGETKNFLQLRLDVLACVQIVKAGILVDNNVRFVKHEKWKRFTDILRERFEIVNNSVESIYGVHPDLRP